MSVRPCLQEDSYSPGFQWHVIDMLSENITKHFHEETFVYFRATHTNGHTTTNVFTDICYLFYIRRQMSLQISVIFFR